MGSRDDDDRVLPTPPPRGPALVRPAAGVLALTLVGAVGAGCAKRNDGQPPMPPDIYPPMPADSGEPPMPDPTVADPPMPEEPSPDETPPMPADGEEPPMPAPDDEPIPPMPPPMPPPHDGKA